MHLKPITPSHLLNAGTVGPSSSSFSSTPLHLPSSQASSSSSSSPSTSNSHDSNMLSKAFGENSRGQPGSGSSNPLLGQHNTHAASGPLSGLIGGQQGDGGRGGEECLAYVLRRPVGGPSYITPLSVEQLVSTMSNTARRCRVGSAFLYVCVCACVCVRMILQLLDTLYCVFVCCTSVCNYLVHASINLVHATSIYTSIYLVHASIYLVHANSIYTSIYLVHASGQS